MYQLITNSTTLKHHLSSGRTLNQSRTEERAHHNLDSVLNNDGIDELTVAQQHGLTPNIQFVIPTYVR